MMNIMVFWAIGKSNYFGYRCRCVGLCDKQDTSKMESEYIANIDVLTDVVLTRIKKL